MTLNTDPNLSDPDRFYAALTQVHRQLEPSQSECVNVRLILLLANHIGDTEVLERAINIAGEIE